MEDLSPGREKHITGQIEEMLVKAGATVSQEKVWDIVKPKQLYLAMDQNEEKPHYRVGNPLSYKVASCSCHRSLNAWWIINFCGSDPITLFL